MNFSQLEVIIFLGQGYSPFFSFSTKCDNHLLFTSVSLIFLFKVEKRTQHILYQFTNVPLIILSKYTHTEKVKRKSG